MLMWIMSVANPKKTHTHTLPVYFCGPIAYSRGLPPFALLAGAPKVEERRRPWRSSRILSPSRCRCRCRCRCPSSSSRCSCRPPAAPRRRRSTRRCTRSRTSRCGCTATPSGCPPPPRTSLPSTSPPSSASTGPYVARPPGPGRILFRSSNVIVVAGWQIVPVPDGRKPQLFEDQDDHPCAHECGSRCRASALLGLLRPAVPAGEVPGFPSGSSPRAEPASRSVARPLRRSEELLGSCTGQERGRGSREARHEPEPVTMG